MKFTKSFGFTVISMFILGVVGLVKAQQHFQPVDNTGNLCAIVVLDVTIDDLSLQVGDEIGVFDGALCVGAGVYEGSYPVSFSAIMEFLLPLGGRLEGAKAGNPMLFKVWRSAPDLEVDALPTYQSGGSFGDVLTVVDPLTVELTAIDHHFSGIPSHFHLNQNTPNPFNPETTIGYQLPAATETRIVIYDVTGRKIKTLVDAVEPAGFHTVTWTGHDDRGMRVGSGVYVMRMEAGSYQQTRKMNVVK